MLCEAWQELSRGREDLPREKDKTMSTTTKTFAIIVEHRGGRTYYHSHVAGTMTCRAANVWTGSRDEAIVLAGTMHGTVVPV